MCNDAPFDASGRTDSAKLNRQETLPNSKYKVSIYGDGGDNNSEATHIWTMAVHKKNKKDFLRNKKCATVCLKYVCQIALFYVYSFFYSFISFLLLPSLK